MVVLSKGVTEGKRERFRKEGLYRELEGLKDECEAIDFVLPRLQEVCDILNGESGEEDNNSEEHGDEELEEDEGPEVDEDLEGDDEGEGKI